MEHGAKTGKANPNWKGGRIIASNGYVLLRMPEHHLADSRGYVYEHRLVAERILGRRLHKGEIPHHIDGNKTNNDPKNIEVSSSIAFHKLRHRRKGSVLQMPTEKNLFIYCACGCGYKFKKFDDLRRPRKYMKNHSWKKGKSKYDRTIMVSCKCGCGAVFPKYDSVRRTRKYVSGHNLHFKLKGF